MRLEVLHSSSAGNAYVLDNGREALLVECGVSFDRVQQSLDFDLSRLLACVVTHEHGDHARRSSIKRCLSYRVPIYMSSGTALALGLSSHPLVHKLEALKSYAFGGFRVVPFDVQHDAREPLGFVISHADMGRMLFATDTYYIRYRFGGLNHILIECNYDDALLGEGVATGAISEGRKLRTLGSHLSYSNCLRYLGALDLGAVRNVVLLHLSGENADAERFRLGVEAETGKCVRIARAGLVLDVSKEPF